MDVHPEAIGLADRDAELGSVEIRRCLRTADLAFCKWVDHALEGVNVQRDWLRDAMHREAACARTRCAAYELLERALVVSDRVLGGFEDRGGGAVDGHIVQLVMSKIDAR